MSRVGALSGPFFLLVNCFANAFDEAFHLWAVHSVELISFDEYGEYLTLGVPVEDIVVFDVKCKFFYLVVSKFTMV